MASLQEQGGRAGRNEGLGRWSRLPVGGAPSHPFGVQSMPPAQSHPSDPSHGTHCRSAASEVSVLHPAFLTVLVTRSPCGHRCPDTRARTRADTRCRGSGERVRLGNARGCGFTLARRMKTELVSRSRAMPTRGRRSLGASAIGSGGVPMRLHYSNLPAVLAGARRGRLALLLNCGSARLPRR